MPYIDIEIGAFFLHSLALVNDSRSAKLDSFDDGRAENIRHGVPVREPLPPLSVLVTCQLICRYLLFSLTTYLVSA